MSHESSDTVITKRSTPPQESILQRGAVGYGWQLNFCVLFLVQTLRSFSFAHFSTPSSLPTLMKAAMH